MNLARDLIKTLELRFDISTSYDEMLRLHDWIKILKDRKEIGLIKRGEI